jgi:hypothetical protein
MSPAGQVANINCSFVICCVISVPAGSTYYAATTNLLMPFWLLVLLRDAARFCAFVS